MKHNKKAKAKKAALPAWSHRRVMLFALLPLALVGLAFTIGLVAVSADYYGRSADKAQAEPIRDFMLTEISQGMPDVPVEPKTGDLYFPEFRLTLPRQADASEPLRLKYTWYKIGDNAPTELTVSNRAVINRVSNEMRRAENLDAVWDAVPHLQACANGITISLTARDNTGSPELKHAVKLTDGRTAFVYLDKTCTELTTTADALAGLRSY